MKKTLSLIVVSFLMICNTSCFKDDSSKNEDEIFEEKTVNIKTFKNVSNAFGNGLYQAKEQIFNFPTDFEKIKQVKMYIQNPCKNKECDEWDTYANVAVKDKKTGMWYELGRFINPYWVGNEKLNRGYEIDVTDFKTLLSGETELKIYTETWSAKGRVYSVDFDFVYGKPDFKYYAVVPVIQYNKSSIDGVPYGVKHTFDLDKKIKFLTKPEVAYFRTIISGWGHATPVDTNDNRPCAEWCFRTHHIAINNQDTFTHELGPIGCAKNPINNQAPGNWKPDRAGWCPGMVVPIRFDVLDKNLFDKQFLFEYKFQDWQNNNKNGKAFYALSTFLVLKSNQPIEVPTIED